MSDEKIAPDAASRTQHAIDQLGRADKVGVAGGMLGTVGGAAAGAAAAGAVAGAAGATTLLGSTGLASLLGGLVVTTTPVGWVLGVAAAGGMAAYGVAKLVRSGGRNDEIRRQTAGALRERLQRKPTPAPGGESQLREFLGRAVAGGQLSDADAQRTMKLVGSGSLSIHAAISQTLALLTG